MEHWNGDVGMKRFNLNRATIWMGIGFVFAVLVIVCIAANPAFTSFNTNQFTISGTGSGQIVNIKDGAKLTNVTVNGSPAAGLVDLDWTNDLTSIRTLTNSSVFIGPVVDEGPNQRVFSMLNVIQTNTPVDAGAEFGSGFFTSDGGNSAIVGNASHGTNGQRCGTMGLISSGGGTINSGVIGTVVTGNDNQTNIGVSGISCSFGAVETNIGVFAGIMLNDNVLPQFTESAALIFDTFAYNSPLALGRTNGSNTVLRFESNGDIKQAGTLYPTGSVFLAGGSIGDVATRRSDGTMAYSNAPVASLSGTIGAINLSVQAGKLPATNYPGIELGQQNQGLVYSKTNAEGTILSLSATWQFKMPKDYATNTMVVSIDSMLLSTNGPNTSNTIFRASVIRATPGDATDVHTASFSSTVSGTNTWTASPTGTNKLQNLLITMGTVGAMGSNDFCILKIDRDAVNDTFGGDVSVVDLRVDYTR